MQKNKRRTHKKSSVKKQEKNPNKNTGYPTGRSNIKLRINILFTLIFSLFLLLLGRLYYIQIIDYAFYADKLKEVDSNTTVIQSMPRGQIFDSKGVLIAETTTVQALTFTRGIEISAEEMRNNAIALVPIVRDLVDPSSLTVRDKKDYFLSDPKNLAAANEALSDKEQYDERGYRLSESVIYSKLIDKVTEEQINFNEEELIAVELYKLMNGTQLYSTSNIVTSNISADLQAQIASELDDLPGLGFGNAWDYLVDSESLLSPLIGTISTEKAGIPEEQLEELLEKGYTMNDRVGTSYLQKGYESVLQGEHKVTKITVNSDGTVKEKISIQEGSQGKNLKLTVDTEFQKSVQSILQSKMDKLQEEGNPHINGIYAVVLNPKTGAILSMNGIDRDTTNGEEINNALSTMTSTFTPGSVVKPATLTAGWEKGVLSSNQRLTAEPILIKGSNPIQDWNKIGFGSIKASEALEFSSNTYMVQIALKLLGQSYQPNMMISNENTVQAYEQLRSSFAEYGLGTSTGIDIPGESQGFVPSTDLETTNTANFLYQSFGQFDNYTPLQLAQFAATIANNGARVAPHIVEGIYSSDNNNLGTLETEIKPKVLNNVNISKEEMDIIQLGMEEVVHGSSGLRTGALMGTGVSVDIYAKTGTSESYASNGEATTVNNVIAYAPGDNPQVAVGIMIPNVSTDTKASQEIVKEIVNLSVKMKVIK
ncbi:MAG: penicillin-binding transpeptidase domain-containing protein [Lactovum sp.]